MDTRGNPSNLWISLRGIPVEYKLDAFNMPRTGTTLCHPKIGNVDLSVIPLSTHLAPFSPLVHINGDNAYSPQIPDTKLTVTSKVQFLQLQHVFRQNPTNTIPHTSDDTRCLLNFLLTHNLLNTSLAAPKANQIFHAANKTLSLLCC